MSKYAEYLPELKTSTLFRNMTDEQLIAIGKQYTRLPVPAFCGTLSAGMPDRFSMTKKAAETQEEAFSLACEEFYLKPEGIYEEKDGCYWLYDAGSGIAYVMIGVQVKLRTTLAINMFLNMFVISVSLTYLPALE